MPPWIRTPPACWRSAPAPGCSPGPSWRTAGPCGRWTWIRTPSPCCGSASGGGRTSTRCWGTRCRSPWISAGPFSVVGNLPYNAATAILTRFLVAARPLGADGVHVPAGGGPEAAGPPRGEGLRPPVHPRPAPLPPDPPAEAGAGRLPARRPRWTRRCSCSSPGRSAGPWPSAGAVPGLPAPELQPPPQDPGQQLAAALERGHGPGAPGGRRAHGRGAGRSGAAGSLAGPVPG